MATPTIRAVADGAWADGVRSRSVTVSGAQVGDTLLVFSLCDYGAADAPSGTWTAGKSAGSGSSSSVGAYGVIGGVTTAGPQTVTLSGTNDSETAMVVYLLSGVDSLDGQEVASASRGSGNEAAPSVTPTGADDLLICVWVAGSFSGAPGYTAPAGMTQDASPSDGNYVTGLACREALSSAGATGTRVASASGVDTGWAAITTAVKGTTSSPPYHGSGTLTLPAVASVDASGERGGGGSVELPATVRLGGIGTRASTGTVELPAAAGFTETATRGAAGTVELPAAAGMVDTGTRAAAGTVELAATAGLTTGGQPQRGGTVELPAAASLTSTGVRSTTHTIELPATARLTLHGEGQTTAAGTVTLPAAASLTLAGTRTSPGTLPLPATAQLKLSTAATLTDVTITIQPTRAPARYTPRQARRDWTIAGTRRGEHAAAAPAAGDWTVAGARHQPPPAVAPARRGWRVVETRPDIAVEPSREISHA